MTILVARKATLVIMKPFWWKTVKNFIDVSFFDDFKVNFSKLTLESLVYIFLGRVKACFSKFSYVGGKLGKNP